VGVLQWRALGERHRIIEGMFNLGGGEVGVALALGSLALTQVRR
jgi:hypothetical protein